MADIRGTIDRRRPPGYPSHSHSVFFHAPGGPDPWRGGARVGVEPEKVNSMCAIGDRRLLDEILDHAKGSAGERRVADRYWEMAAAGPMGSLARHARRFDEPEIFCPSPVRPEALYRMD